MNFEIDSVLPLLEVERGNGKKVVLVTCTFDVPNPSDFEFLTYAKQQGDILIVGINQDSFVVQMKGRGRPVLTQDVRAQMVVNLKPVNFVFYSWGNKFETTAHIKPDVVIFNNSDAKSRYAEKRKDKVEKLQTAFPNISILVYNDEGKYVDDEQLIKKIKQLPKTKKQP